MATQTKPITIRDVARASGVSPATVSYVINDGPRRVDPTTRLRIMREIDRLRYHPSSVARGLSRKRMNAVGVVFPQRDQRLLVDSYFNSLLDGVVAAATDREQNVMLYTGLEWQGRDKMHGFLDQRVDGLILLAIRADSELVTALSETDRPFVVVNDTSENPRVRWVDIDNVAAVRMVIDHLASLGHRRIGLLSGEASSPSTCPRREGFVRAMQANGLAVDPNTLIEGFYSKDWGEVGMAELLDRPNPPTAVFAGGDGIAVGALATCVKRGVSVPGDMSIVGFDDAPYARESTPPLTTVVQPLQEIGITAAGLLLDIVEGKADADDDNAPSLNRILPTRLVVRQSTGAPEAPGFASARNGGERLQKRGG